MNINVRKILKVAFFALAVIAIPFGVFLSKRKQEIRKGATGNNNHGQIKLSPSTTVYTPGQPINVDISFNTDGVFISGVAATVIFDSSPDFVVSEIQKKNSDLFCSPFKQTAAGDQIKMGIACFASGAGAAFSQDTVIGSFTITPQSSATGDFVINFLPEETEMKGKNGDQIVSVLGDLPSPAGVYADSQSPSSPPPATNPPTEPPASPTEPADTSPTATPTGGIGGSSGESNCSEVVFTSPKPGGLPKNPEKLSKNFISSAEGSISLAKIYLSSNANWNNSDPEITLWVNNIEADQTIVLQRHTPGAWYTFTFTDTKPVVARGENILVEIQQSSSWITGASWDSNSQNQVLKLAVNCLASADTPTPSPTVTPANPTSTPPAATATPIPTTTPADTPPPAASPTGASPTTTPEPIACSVKLSPDQCVCAGASATPPGNSPACGQIMRKRGDFNCSGDVDMADFNQWAINFVSRHLTEDMDCDGQAGISDFNTWLTNYLNNLQ